MMSNEAYVECLVKRRTPVYALPVKIGAGALAAASLVYAMGSIWGFALLAVVAAGAYLLIPQMYIEYEYLYIDGELSVDKILNKSRRKKVLECQKDEILAAGPMDAPRMKDFETSGVKVKDCSSGDASAVRYVLFFQRGADRQKVIFEPSEEMVRVMSHTIPQKMVK